MPKLGGCDNLHVAGGVDDLANYEKSIYSESKKKLIRSFAELIGKIFNKPGLENKDINQIQKELRVIIPNWSKKTIKGDAQVSVCRKMSSAINQLYGREVINMNGTPEEQCQAVGEYVDVLFTGLQGEFIQISKDVSERIQGLELLLDILTGSQRKIHGMIENTKDASLAREVENTEWIMKEVMIEANKQLAHLKNMLNVAIAPASKNIFAQMEKQSSLKGFFDKLRKAAGTQEFGTKLTYVIDGIELLSYTSHVIEKALKDVGVSVDEYKKTDTLDKLNDLLFDRMQKMEKSATFDEVNKFFSASEILRKNEYNHKNIVERMGSKDSYTAAKNTQNRKSLKDKKNGAKRGGRDTYGGDVYDTTQADREEKIDYRLGQQTKNKKIISRDFTSKLNTLYKRFTSSIDSVVKKIGVSIPLSDKLDDFRKALERFDDATVVENQAFIKALLGEYDNADAREYKARFISELKYVSETAGKVPELKDVKLSADAMIEVVDKYSDVMGKVRIIPLTTKGRDLDEREDTSTDGAADGGGVLSYVNPTNAMGLLKDPHGTMAKLSTATAVDRFNLYRNSVKGLLPDNVNQRIDQGVNRLQGMIGVKTGYTSDLTDQIVDQTIDQNNTTNVVPSGGMYGGADCMVNGMITASCVAQVTQNAYDLKKMVQHFNYFYRVARIRDNLRRMSGENDAYSKRYDDVLGTAIGNRITTIRKERVEAIKKVETEFNALPDADKRVTEKIRENETLKNWIKTAYSTREKLYKTLEAVDIYLGGFADGLAKHPDDLGDLIKMLDSLQINSRWYTEKAGDNFALMFEHNASEEKSKLMKEIANGTKPYYELAKINMLDDLNIASANFAKTFENVDKAVCSITVLKNIVSTFVYIGKKFGDTDLLSKCPMSPAQIYKNLIEYTFVSSFDVKGFSAFVTPSAGTHLIQAGNVATVTYEFRTVSDAGKTSIFDVDDRYFSMVLQAMVAKVLTAIGTYVMLERPSISKLDNPTNPVRQIIGGNDIPSVDPDTVELYIRLPLLLEFYRELHNIYDIEAITDKMITMIPEFDNVWNHLIEFIYDKTRYVKMGTYSAAQVAEIVRLVNDIKSKYGAINPKDTNREVILGLVAEMNRRYGIYCKNEIEEWIKSRDTNKFERLNDSQATNFEILPHEGEPDYPRVSPSDRFVELDRDYKASDKDKLKDLKLVEMVTDFRNKIEKSLTNYVNNYGNHNYSFDENIRQVQHKIRHSQDSSEKLKVVTVAIQGSSRLSTLSSDKLVLFHETVIAPLYTLKRLMNYVETFINHCSHFDLDLVIEMIREQKDNHDAVTSTNKYQDNKYCNNDKIKDYVKGDTGTWTKVLPIDVMHRMVVDLINVSWNISGSTNGLVEMTIDSSNNLIFDASKLIHSAEQTLKGVRYAVERFRKVFEKDLIREYVDEQVTSIQKIEDLFDRCFRGKYMNESKHSKNAHADDLNMAFENLATGFDCILSWRTNTADGNTRINISNQLLALVQSKLKIKNNSTLSFYDPLESYKDQLLMKSASSGHADASMDVLNTNNTIVKLTNDITSKINSDDNVDNLQKLCKYLIYTYSIINTYTQGKNTEGNTIVNQVTHDDLVTAMIKKSDNSIVYTSYVSNTNITINTDKDKMTYITQVNPSDTTNSLTLVSKGMVISGDYAKCHREILELADNNMTTLNKIGALHAKMYKELTLMYEKHKLGITDVATYMRTSALIAYAVTNTGSENILSNYMLMDKVELLNDFSKDEIVYNKYLVKKDENKSKIQLRIKPDMTFKIMIYDTANTETNITLSDPEKQSFLPVIMGFYTDIQKNDYSSTLVNEFIEDINKYVDSTVTKKIESTNPTYFIDNIPKNTPLIAKETPYTLNDILNSGSGDPSTGMSEKDKISILLYGLAYRHGQVDSNLELSNIKELFKDNISNVINKYYYVKFINAPNVKLTDNVATNLDVSGKVIEKMEYGNNNQILRYMFVDRVKLDGSEDITSVYMLTFDYNTPNIMLYTRDNSDTPNETDEKSDMYNFDSENFKYVKEKTTTHHSLDRPNEPSLFLKYDRVKFGNPKSKSSRLFRWMGITASGEIGYKRGGVESPLNKIANDIEAHIEIITAILEMKNDDFVKFYISSTVTDLDNKFNKFASKFKNLLDNYNDIDINTHVWLLHHIFDKLGVKNISDYIKMNTETQLSVPFNDIRVHPSLVEDIDKQIVKSKQSRDGKGPSIMESLNFILNIYNPLETLTNNKTNNINIGDVQEIFIKFNDLLNMARTLIGKQMNVSTTEELMKKSFQNSVKFTNANVDTGYIYPERIRSLFTTPFSNSTVSALKSIKETPSTDSNRLKYPTFYGDNPIVFKEYVHTNLSTDTWDSMSETSLLSMFNQIITHYVDTMYDMGMEKIYSETINDFVNSLGHKAVVEGVGYPSVIKDKYYSLMHRAPVDVGVAYALRRLYLEKDRTDKPRFMQSDITQITDYTKETMRGTLCYYRDLLNMLINRAAFIKLLVNVKLNNTINDKSNTFAAADNSPIEMPVNYIKQVDGEKSFVTSNAMSHADTTKYLNIAIDNIVNSSKSFIKCINTSMKALGDAPVFGEIYKGSIADYRAQFANNPLVPLSIITLAFNGNTSDQNKLIPVGLPGDNHFKYNYTVRALMCNESRVEDSILTKDIINEFNSRVTSDIAFSVNDYYSTANEYVAIARFLARGYMHRKLYRSNLGDSADLMSPLVKIAHSKKESSVTPYTSMENTTMNDIISLIDNSNQRVSISKMTECITGTDQLINTREALRAYNIIDLNIIPVNFHALRREIPLINIMNYSYTFSKMIENLDSVMAHHLMKPYNKININAGLHQYYEFMIGATGTGMGRPRFLSDQIWNKLMFQQLSQTKDIHRAGPLPNYDTYTASTSNYSVGMKNPEYTTVTLGVDPILHGHTRGTEKFNTIIVRHMFMFICMHMVMRHKMRDELDKLTSPVVQKIQAVNRKITEFDEKMDANTFDKDLELEDR